MVTGAGKGTLIPASQQLCQLINDNEMIPLISHQHFEEGKFGVTSQTKYGSQGMALDRSSDHGGIIDGQIGQWIWR